MNHSVIITLLVLLVGSLLSGCRSSVARITASASSDITSIEITINDNFYGPQNSNLSDPPTWTVPRGADILAVVNNEGTLTHNWAVLQKDATISVPFTEGQSSQMIKYGAGMIYGQNRTTMTFSAPEEIGEYLVICTVPGHYPSMQGRLVVE